MKRSSGLLVLLAACLPTDMPDRERPAVLTARDLADFGISVPDPARHETWKRYVNFDGSRSLEYEYSDSDSGDLYLSVMIDIEKSMRSAQAGVAVSKNALVAGYWIEKIAVRDDSAMVYGDHSYFGTLWRDSVRVGTLAVVRRGLIVYTVVLGGYLLDAEQWHSLFDAKFRHADSLFPAVSSPRP